MKSTASLCLVVLAFLFASCGPEDGELPIEGVPFDPQGTWEFSFSEDPELLSAYPDATKNASARITATQFKIGDVSLPGHAQVGGSRSALVLFYDADGRRLYFGKTVAGGTSIESGAAVVISEQGEGQYSLPITAFTVSGPYDCISTQQTDVQVKVDSTATRIDLTILHDTTLLGPGCGSYVAYWSQFAWAPGNEIDELIRFWSVFEPSGVVKTAEMGTQSTLTTKLRLQAKKIDGGLVAPASAEALLTSLFGN